jgi:hypothetical protein
MRPYLEKKKKITKRGWWSGSRCWPLVKFPEPPKKKKKKKKTTKGERKGENYDTVK